MDNSSKENIMTISDNFSANSFENRTLSINSDCFDEDIEEPSLFFETYNNNDSKDHLVLSIPSISNYYNKNLDTNDSVEVKTVKSEKRKYWKINFAIVLFPLAFTGMPIHLLLFGRRGINSCGQWYKQIFIKDPFCLRLFTYFYFFVGLGINGFFLYLTGSLLYSLVILGKIRSSIFEDIITVVRIAPIVLPMNAIWVCGYAIRKLILSFDRITYPEVEVESKKLARKWKSGWRNVAPYRLKLFGVYLGILLNQAIHFFILNEKIGQIKRDELVNDKEAIIRDHWIDFSLVFKYNMMLPIYMCLCWGIQFEFERLSLYIKSLISCKAHPDFDNLAEIKKYYKQVGNHCCLVNDTCSIFYSWILFVLYTSMYQEIGGLITVIVDTIARAFTGTGTIGGGVEPDPVNVRLFVGNFFAPLTQLALLFLTIWICTNANEQARHLHVRLNDFVTSDNVTLTPELYKKFRMVKNYMHSRMEQEMKPALLSITIVSAIPYCNCLYVKMTRYRVRH